MSTESSVLEQDYNEPNRPYSQKELKYIKENFFRSIRLSITYAEHKKCQHFYKVKLNGRKEKEMKEKDSLDVGNCSVCWKLSKTPRNLKENANKLIYSFLENNSDYLTFVSVDTEICFYKWLYLEFM
jgi:hypothetical protein